MRNLAVLALLVVSASFPLAAAEGGGQPSSQSELYAGWLRMYDLKFDDAHRIFSAWKQTHPGDAMGPVSNAAAYLFSELARLGALESELFIDNSRFEHRAKLYPDPGKKALFTREIAQAESLANLTLQKSATDQTALLVKSLTFGLRADDAGLVEKQSLAALSYTKEGRAWAERLMEVNPQAFDAYLGPGLENYLLSLKPAPLRMLLRVTGSNVDREKGIEEIRETAFHGYYLEPFAKLLLAVASLRDNNPVQARDILSELHRRFPDNELYTRELSRIEKSIH